MTSLEKETIKKALDKALEQARKQGKLSLNSSHRYIIFSDHHKGARNNEDDFWRCEPAYQEALDYYLKNQYTLIVLGDAEELWEEEDPEPVLKAYENILKGEALFHPDRYIRIYGNHNEKWISEKEVKKYLDSFFPNIKFKEGLVFEFSDGNGAGGEIFLVHGHQGTLDSDKFSKFSKLIVRNVWRPFQRLTGLGRETPATDVCLRGEHDTVM